MGTDEVKNDALGGLNMGLRLAVLSRGPRLYSTRRIVEEAKKRGLDVEVCDPMKFSLVVNQGSVDVLHKGRRSPRTPSSPNRAFHHPARRGRVKAH